MRKARFAAGAFTVAVLGGMLGGCQTTQDFFAPCTTSPPVPNHDKGFVHLSMDAPAQVVTGSQFTIRVDFMDGKNGVPPGGDTSHPQGVINVTGGGVSPSGDFTVGPGIFGTGPDFPVTLTFFAVGDPGAQIQVKAVSGSSFEGDFPNSGTLINCTANVVAATIPVVEPG